MNPKQTPSLESLVAQAFNEDWDDETLLGMWEMLGRPGLAHWKENTENRITTKYVTSSLAYIHRNINKNDKTDITDIFHINYGALTKKTIIRPKEKYKYV